MEVHLVRVITDERHCKLWVAATPRNQAVNEVLNSVPEGWSAALLYEELSAEEVQALSLNPGEVCEIASKVN